MQQKNLVSRIFSGKNVVMAGVLTTAMLTATNISAYNAMSLQLEQHEIIDVMKKHNYSEHTGHKDAGMLHMATSAIGEYLAFTESEQFPPSRPFIYDLYNS